MCVQIDTTRSVASQILRHRSFSFQEFSQRYAQVVNTPALPNFRRQDTSNRQNSIDDLNEYTQQEFQIRTQHLFDESLALYNEMLAAGVVQEMSYHSLHLLNSI
jgi:thymidylate synthase (FAD)